MYLYNIFKSFLRLFNLSITRYDFYEKLKKNQKDLENFKILVALDRTDIEKKKTFIDISNSELKQDFFVLNTLNFKKGGYFVEFGSCNGLEFSNTLLLEKKFGWNGILAEPARYWHNELKKNRNAILKPIVYGKSLVQN